MTDLKKKKIQCSGENSKPTCLNDVPHAHLSDQLSSVDGAQIVPRSFQTHPGAFDTANISDRI